MLMAGQCNPHFLFGLAEKKTGRARSKRKERFGGSVCASADLLPPAGEGWLSLAAVRDGNALPLVKPLAWGGTGIHPASLPAAAHASSKSSQRQRKEKQLNASTTPTQEHHPPRDGSCKLAEDLSVPEGQAKSEQAPIRRPPSRAEGRCTGARPAPFSLPPGAAHSLFGQDQKENGGRIPCGSRAPFYPSSVS